MSENWVMITCEVALAIAYSSASSCVASVTLPNSSAVLRPRIASPEIATAKETS